MRTIIVGPALCSLEAKVRERTMQDLRGLITELVAVDENGKDQLSTLDQPDVQKLKSIFAHAKLDLTDIASKVRSNTPSGPRCSLPL